VSNSKGELDMAKVYATLEIQLKPGAKAEDLEKFFVEEWIPLPTTYERLNYLGLFRRESGPGEAQYLSVYVYDSVEARDLFKAGQLPDHADQPFKEIRSALMTKFREMVTWTTTYYVKVGG
jgi:hypothetical protein